MPSHLKKPSKPPIRIAASVVRLKRKKTYSTFCGSWPLAKRNFSGRPEAILFENRKYKKNIHLRRNFVLGYPLACFFFFFLRGGGGVMFLKCLALLRPREFKQIPAAFGATCKKHQHFNKKSTMEKQKYKTRVL